MRLAAAFTAFMAMCAAQQPAKLIDAKLETRPLNGGSLVSEVGKLQGPAWIAWQVASVPSARQMCCSSDRCSWGCSLVDRGNWNDGNCTNDSATPPVVKLEGYREAYVFVRVENRQVTRIRTFSPDCQIDAGGLPVVWLTSVAPAQGIAFMKTFVHWDGGRLAEHAVDVIALHDAPEVPALLEGYLSSTGNPSRVRRKAAFWLGNSHPSRGVPLLAKLAKEDADLKLRENLMQPLSLSKAGVAALIDLANSKQLDAKVREKAVFWLARSEEPEARRFIEGVLGR